MSIEQAITLASHLFWPVVALIALFVLRPYISQVSRAASDLRALLNRSGEMVDLVGQITALNEATSDIKAMQQVAQAARPEVIPVAGQASLEHLWQKLDKEWKETRESFRSVSQAANVPVSFVGNVGVRDAAKALVEKGLISEMTASGVVDLSAQYQYMFRTTTDRSEYLNDNVVAAYTKTATRVRQALKSGQ